MKAPRRRQQQKKKKKLKFIARNYVKVLLPKKKQQSRDDFKGCKRVERILQENVTEMIIEKCS